MIEMVARFNLTSFGYLRLFTTRVLNFGNQIIEGHFKIWVFQSFNSLIAIGSLLSLLFALGCAYLFVFPSFRPVTNSVGIPKSNSSFGVCNVFEGRWIRDDSYPLYNASQCPFAERGFNCLANGRKDRNYLKWRWKPKNCEVPRFNVHAILEKLRGKRVVFVGDSMSRTQWESLICLLMTGVENKSSVYEVNGNKITKQIRFLGVRFSSFNFTIEFYRSVYLVQPGLVPRRAPKRVKSTLKLNKLDDISHKWIDSDFLIFNTGQWWVPGKLFETGCYFQVGGSLKLGMSIKTAFRIALNTWASWVETTINTNRTRVFFRTFESSHWSGRMHRICKVSRNPLTKTKGRERSSFSDIIMKVVNNMTVPATALHVTPMGSFRSDAHVGTWSDTPLVPDCSHWCLPGVPDMWNEILFSYLLS
ncbi:hypothetical protein L1049_025872 [Liquidambar formosana]|uniref:Trichome birefringence-like N-terminal domain-containing protein n=1 Tax=Liquidambar formosana TaxID=63359 RepID=A0AAP0NFC2_LIQFO